MQNQRKPVAQQQTRPMRTPTQSQRPQQRPAQANVGQQRKAPQPVRKAAPKRKQSKPKWVWIVGGVVVVLLLAIILGGGGNEQPQSSDQQSQSNSTVQSNVQNSTAVFPITAYDANNIKVVVTGYNPNSLFGKEIEYTFENNSSVPVMLGVGEAYIDGWQIFTLGGETLPAGTKSNGTITLSEDDLQKSGITNITSISIKECNLWNDDNYELIDTFSIMVDFE